MEDSKWYFIMVMVGIVAFFAYLAVNQFLDADLAQACVEAGKTWTSNAIEGGTCK